MNMKIELENCQKSLTLKDFEEVESKLGHVLPERLKEFYLQYNGGSTKQTASINKYQEVEIEDFFPFKYNKDFKNDPRYTAEGETLEQYLSGKIFGGETGTVMEPDPADVAGFDAYIENYKKALEAEKAAVETMPIL